MMKSWYDLTKKQAQELEHEFLNHEVAKEENMAMHLQIVIAVFVLVLCTTTLTMLLFFLGNITWYLFIILLLGIIVGILLVVLSTVEYHAKFNSWLEVKHKIIKK